jgi:RecB family endonuclease NucS
MIAINISKSINNTKMKNISKIISIFEKISEHEIEQFIINNPISLNIGDIEIIKSQHNQPNGILDILGYDKSLDTYYEIELLRGEIDSVHITHVLDYWANEKRIKQKSKHIAVLIAESLKGRYQTLVSTLPYDIPLICCEFTLFRYNTEIFFYNSIIYFPKILNYINIDYNKYYNHTVSRKIIYSRQYFNFITKILENPDVIKESYRFMASYIKVPLGSVSKYLKLLNQLNFIDDEKNIVNIDLFIEHVKDVERVI